MNREHDALDLPRPWDSCPPQNLCGDGFQLVVMMQAAETWLRNDAMSGL